MKKTIIYFLRHGEVYNPKNILYGRWPGFPLSVSGKKSINDIVNYFRTRDIKAIYTSPMLRTRQTANILGDALGIKPKISKLINEVRLIFENIPLKVFKIKIQPTLYNEKNIKLGQESIENISTRMFKFLRIIGKRHQGKKILAVSHGDPILIIKAAILGVCFTNEYKKKNYLKTGQWLKLICEGDNYTWE